MFHSPNKISPLPMESHLNDKIHIVVEDCGVSNDDSIFGAGFTDIYKAPSSFVDDSIWGFIPKMDSNVNKQNTDLGGSVEYSNSRTIPKFPLDNIPEGYLIPKLGVSVEFLLRLKNLCISLYGEDSAGKITTKEVSKRLFSRCSTASGHADSFSTSKETLGTPFSFLEHFRSYYSQVDHPVVGFACSPALVSNANIYVTHCWSNTFDALVDALQEFSRQHYSGHETAFFWLDVFLSVDELAGESLINSKSSRSLHHNVCLHALQCIGKVCLLLMPWSDPVALRNARCLLELLVSYSSSCELFIQLSKKRHQSYLKLCSVNYPAAENAIEFNIRTTFCGDYDGDSLADVNSTELKAIKEKFQSFHEGEGFAAVDIILNGWLSSSRITAAIKESAMFLQSFDDEMSLHQFEIKSQQNAIRTPESASILSTSLCSRLISFLENIKYLIFPGAPHNPLDRISTNRREIKLLTIKVRANLAYLLHKKGRYSEAELLYKQLLRDQLMQQPSDGSRPENHPLALSATGNLALLLQSQGRDRWEEAETLYRRVLARKKLVLGALHPSTLTTTYNLAVLLEKQPSRRCEAEGILRTLLQQQKVALGREHEDCMRSMETLVGILLESEDSKTRNDAEAEESTTSALSLLQELLILRTDRWGAYHHQTLSTAEVLAGVYLQRGRPDLAVDLYEEALLGRETVCGQSHKATWTARLRFATVLKLLGQRERARNLFSLLASYYPPQLGESHPTSVAVVTSLAELHMLCGQAISAEGILRSLILICDRGGVSSLHAEFLLGECLMMLSRFDEAELLHRRVLGKRRQILGWSHIDTFRSMHALANALVSQRQWQEGKKLLEAAVEGLDTLLGPRHPYSTNAAEVLWRICRHTGDQQQVERLNSRMISQRSGDADSRSFKTSFQFTKDSSDISAGMNMRYSTNKDEEKNGIFDGSTNSSEIDELFTEYGSVSRMN